MIRSPCTHCPFRRDQVGMLRRGRRREIARSLLRGDVFWCHKTVDYSAEDEHGESAPSTDAAQWCAGALLTMENEPAGMMQCNGARIAVRLRLVDPLQMTGSELVFGSLREWERGSS